MKIFIWESQPTAVYTDSGFLGDFCILFTLLVVQSHGTWEFSIEIFNKHKTHSCWRRNLVEAVCQFIVIIARETIILHLPRSWFYYKSQILISRYSYLLFTLLVVQSHGTWKPWDNIFKRHNSTQLTVLVTPLKLWINCTYLCLYLENKLSTNQWKKLLSPRRFKSQPNMLIIW